MKQEDLAKRVMEGHCVLVGTYVGGVVNARSYLDAKSGKTRELRGITHTLIAGSRPVLVNEYLADGLPVEQIQLKQQPGKKYVVAVGGFEEDKGVVRVRLNGLPMEELN